jgi:hypothetical protein
MLLECCSILDVPEPELYAQQGGVNAYTSGHTHPFIILETGLLEMMDDSEVMAVIAHELGHIKCGHVLYKMMARGIKPLLEMASNATMGIGGLVGAGVEAGLLAWDRRAELSADRAALLVMQDVRPCVTMLMKLAGGTKRHVEWLDAEQLLNQARAYKEGLDQSMTDRFYRFMATRTTTHPFPVERARAQETKAQILQRIRPIIDRANTKQALYQANATKYDTAIRNISALQQAPLKTEADVKKALDIMQRNDIYDSMVFGKGFTLAINLSSFKAGVRAEAGRLTPKGVITQIKSKSLSLSKIGGVNDLRSTLTSNLTTSPVRTKASHTASSQIDPITAGVPAGIAMAALAYVIAKYAEEKAEDIEEYPDTGVSQMGECRSEARRDRNRRLNNARGDFFREAGCWGQYAIDEAACLLLPL